MAINFPNSPSVNDAHTVGSQTWIWDGAVWQIATSNVSLNARVSVLEAESLPDRVAVLEAAEIPLPLSPFLLMGA